jgi:hypothetical protein
MHALKLVIDALSFCCCLFMCVLVCPSSGWGGVGEYLNRRARTDLRRKVDRMGRENAIEHWKKAFFD